MNSNLRMKLRTQLTFSGFVYLILTKLWEGRVGTLYWFVRLQGNRQQWTVGRCIIIQVFLCPSLLSPANISLRAPQSWFVSEQWNASFSTVASLSRDIGEGMNEKYRLRLPCLSQKVSNKVSLKTFNIHFDYKNSALC